MKFPSASELTQALRRVRRGVPREAWPDIYRVVSRSKAPGFLSAGPPERDAEAGLFDFALGLVAGIACVEAQRPELVEASRQASELLCHPDPAIREKAHAIHGALNRTPISAEPLTDEELRKFFDEFFEHEARHG